MPQLSSFHTFLSSTEDHVLETEALIMALCEELGEVVNDVGNGKRKHTEDLANARNVEKKQSPLEDQLINMLKQHKGSDYILCGAPFAQEVA